MVTPLLSGQPRTHRGAVASGGRARRLEVVGAGVLGGELVFLDQSAEQVTAADAIEIDHVGHRALITGWRPVERWPLGECAVRERAGYLGRRVGAQVGRIRGCVFPV